MAILLLVVTCSLTVPGEAFLVVFVNDQVCLTRVKILANNQILLDGSWLFVEWPRNPIHASLRVGNLSNSILVGLVWAIVADEAVREESQEGIVLVTLHHGGSGDLTWNEHVVSQLGEMVSVL